MLRFRLRLKHRVDYHAPYMDCLCGDEVFKSFEILQRTPGRHMQTTNISYIDESLLNRYSKSCDFFYKCICTNNPTLQVLVFFVLSQQILMYQNNQQRQSKKYQRRCVSKMSKPSALCMCAPVAAKATSSMVKFSSFYFF